MKLVVGLGNPGDKYIHTRHNVGFVVVDKLAGSKGWEYKKKFNAEICRYSVNVLLVKPQTFMNNSGEAVSAIVDYYKNGRDPSTQVEGSTLAQDDKADRKIISTLSTKILVVHDDVDLPLGKVKEQLGGSSAGHRGVQSIIDYLGTSEFTRYRIGIGHPRDTGSQMPTDEYVLQRFGKEEHEDVAKSVADVARKIEEKL